QQTRMIRQRLQELLGRHFAAEDSLRSLEIADIEHRLEQVRAETERRRRERAELVRREVDEILRQAVRPESQRFSSLHRKLKHAIHGLRDHLGVLAPTGGPFRYRPAAPPRRFAL